MRINNFKLSWFNLFKLLYLLYSAKRQYQSSDNPVEYRSGFYDNHSGLCANIGAIIGNDEVLLFDEIFPFWPHFSGNHIFPIKSSTYLSDALAYHEAVDKGLMLSGAYGRDRIDLLDFYVRERVSLLNVIKRKIAGAILWVINGITNDNSEY